MDCSCGVGVCERFWRVLGLGLPRAISLGQRALSGCGQPYGFGQAGRKQQGRQRTASEGVQRQRQRLGELADGAQVLRL